MPTPSSVEETHQCDVCSLRLAHTPVSRVQLPTSSFHNLSKESTITVINFPFRPIDGSPQLVELSSRTSTSTRRGGKGQKAKVEKGEKAKKEKRRRGGKGEERAFKRQREERREVRSNFSFILRICDIPSIPVKHKTNHSKFLHDNSPIAYYCMSPPAKEIIWTDAALAQPPSTTCSFRYDHYEPTSQ